MILKRPRGGEGYSGISDSEEIEKPEQVLVTLRIEPSLMRTLLNGDDDIDRETAAESDDGMTAPSGASLGRRPARKAVKIDDSDHEMTDNEANRKDEKNASYDSLDDENDDDGSDDDENVEVKDDQDYNENEDSDSDRPRRRKHRVKPGRKPGGQNRKAGSDSEEEFQDNSGSDEDEEDDDSDSVVSDLPADTGFIVDSDDNVIGPRSKTRKTSKKRKRGRPRINETRGRRRRLRSQGNVISDDEQDEDQLSNSNGDGGERDEDDLMALRQELRDLRDSVSPPPTRTHVLRKRKQVNYQLIPPGAILDDIPSVQPPSKQSSTRGRGGGSGPTRRLFPILGPFGGQDVFSLYSGGAPPLGAMTNTNNMIAAAAAESDSSDDENVEVLTGGGTHAGAGGVVGASSNPFGLIKKKKPGLADVDPLGINTDIDFDSVGGLDDYIGQLKEMVSLPLRYPEVYARFGITPPRGVLFHGPPGTGKTLMARALAASCSKDGGKKVAFFMRKGADCLSKWVGEAERQLRLLFEEARAQQPAIIFFDEIDGLAPVRSSKQEQIHASIVSTLLALMDGMDNRGQVIVIGATNRPDSVDPALRRPGRFDREFYFPLPNLQARRRILEIHTRKWQPPLGQGFLDHMAEMTKGYGGADLRALCTEAALGSILRTYPQIYFSSQKLQIDPSAIHVIGEDFAKALEKIVPSSSRALSSSSSGMPLPDRVEPLLRTAFKEISHKLMRIAPVQKKKQSAVEDALYESPGGYENIRGARVYRPRLLVYGPRGMGQSYIGSALLHELEGYNVQMIDIASLYGDPSRTPESVVVQTVAEARKHRPSVLYLPDVDGLLAGISESARVALFSMIQSIDPNDQVVVLGLSFRNELDSLVKDELFGFARENYGRLIAKVDANALEEFFFKLIEFIRLPPSAVCDEAREKRKLPELPVVDEKEDKTNDALASEEVMTEADKRRQAKQDIQLKNTLKVKLSVIMELVKNRYKRFKKPVIEDSHLVHLFDRQENELLAKAKAAAEMELDQEINDREADRDEGIPELENGAVRAAEVNGVPDDTQITTEPNGAGETEVSTRMDVEEPEVISVIMDEAVALEEPEQAYVQATDAPNMILEVATGKKYYNMDLDIIEERLWNGYYSVPRQFLQDIAMIYKDSQTLGERERIIKAAEMHANVQVLIEDLGRNEPALVASCREMYKREKALSRKDKETGGLGHRKEHEEKIVDEDKSTSENHTGNDIVILPEHERESEKENHRDNEVMDIDNVPNGSVNGKIAQKMILDEESVQRFKAKLLALEKRQLSVEKLEQINASLVETVWEMRDRWDRNQVVERLEQVLEEINDFI